MSGRLAWLGLLAVVALALCRPAWAGPAAVTSPNTRFVVIGFHDVVDAGQPLDSDAVTVDRLVGFLDWLKADGWTVISAADVSAAAEGRKSLPPKAIVLCFDDGYVSFYRRVYPLLLAYRYPAVLSLVGEWMDQPLGSVVDYGGRPVPREYFLTWDQVRTMRASGLVEVASHTYDLHQTIRINAQGNVVGAPRAWMFDEATGRAETDQQHMARIRADLVQSRKSIARETGAAPHVLVWPYGRFSGLAMNVAKELGFDQIYSLTPERADAREPLRIPRYYPTRDPELGEVVKNLGFDPRVWPTVRAACLDLAPLAAASGAAEQDAVLGRMIEDLRSLGPNLVVIDALRYSPDDGRPVASWVSTTLLPVEADILSRAARQIGLRAGVDVYVRLRVPELVAAVGEQGVMDLAQQVARGAPLTGIALDGRGAAGPPGRVLEPVDLRVARAAVDAGSPLTLRVMRAATVIGAQLRLMVWANPGDQGGPPPGADMIVWPPAPTAEEAAAQAERLRAAGWFTAGHAGRILLGVPRVDPKHQVQAIRAMQAHGANAIALCPWTPGDSKVLAPAFSAATFPYRP